MKRVALLLTLATLVGSTLQALDRNGNGLSDIWESLYSVPATADLTSDTDGDGQTLFEEAQFGTDPHNPFSVTRAALTPGPASTLTLRLGTQPGKRYQIDSSVDLITWQPLGAPVIGDGTTRDILGLTVDSLTPDRLFFRPRYLDEIDADGDGLTAWEEAQLGLSDLNPDFDDDGLIDGFEVGGGLNPQDNGATNTTNGSDGDSDNDGLTNAEEQLIGTHPNNEDSDNDGKKDGEEAIPTDKDIDFLRTDISRYATIKLPAAFNPDRMHANSSGMVVSVDDEGVGKLWVSGVEYTIPLYTADELDMSGESYIEVFIDDFGKIVSHQEFMGTTPYENSDEATVLEYGVS